MSSTKVTKSYLKSLVKECLIEILQEGLSFNDLGSVKEVKKQTTRSIEQNPQHTGLGHRQSQQVKREVERKPLSLMESIFADTAKTTLHAMMENDRGMQFESDSSSSAPAPENQFDTEQFTGTPESVFGSDIASKWSALAFNEHVNPTSKQ